MKTTDSARLFSVADAARELGVVPQRVRALIAAGRLSATRIGARAWVIRAGDLERVRVRKPGRPVRA